MYLQMVLVCIGVGLMLVNLWILLLTPLAGWVLPAAHEPLRQSG